MTVQSGNNSSTVCIVFALCTLQNTIVCLEDELSAVNCWNCIYSRQHCFRRLDLIASNDLLARTQHKKTRYTLTPGQIVKIGYRQSAYTVHPLDQKNQHCQRLLPNNTTAIANIDGHYHGALVFLCVLQLKLAQHTQHTQRSSKHIRTKTKTFALDQISCQCVSHSSFTHRYVHCKMSPREQRLTFDQQHWMTPSSSSSISVMCACCVPSRLVALISLSAPSRLYFQVLAWSSSSSQNAQYTLSPSLTSQLATSY